MWLVEERKKEDASEGQESEHREDHIVYEGQSAGPEDVNGD